MPLRSATDIARDKDKLLGEAVWEEYLRKTGRKPKRRAQVSVFVDSSVWFAAANIRDQHNDTGQGRSLRELRRTVDDRSCRGRDVAPPQQPIQPRSGRGVSGAGYAAAYAMVEYVTPADVEAAWAIRQRFADQTFSLVDRTSFAVMERLGLTRVASFDRDFAIYRYGRNRDKAFEVLR